MGVLEGDVWVWKEKVGIVLDGSELLVRLKWEIRL